MSLRNSIRIAISVVVLLSLGAASYSQRRRPDRRDEGRWEQLGSAHVDGRTDHDRIRVDNPGAFRAIQLGVRGGTIEFYRVVVHFEEGADHEVEVRDRITAGGKTRVIDLPGNRRRIKSVEFWYGKNNSRTRPTVNLWGRR